MKGCNKSKCLCRVWAQCSYYNDWKWKQNSNDEYMTIINDWYDTHFRLKYEQTDDFSNG